MVQIIPLSELDLLADLMPSPQGAERVRALQAAAYRAGARTVLWEGNWVGFVDHDDPTEITVTLPAVPDPGPGAGSRWHRWGRRGVLGRA